MGKNKNKNKGKRPGTAAEEESKDGTQAAAQLETHDKVQTESVAAQTPTNSQQ